MIVSAYQEKKENEKTGKREAGEEERKQSTDHRKAACCPSAVFQTVAQQKNGLYERECPGYLGSSERPTNILIQSKRIGDCTTPLRQLLIIAEHLEFVFCNIIGNDYCILKFISATFTSLGPKSAGIQNR